MMNRKLTLKNIGINALALLLVLSTMLSTTLVQAESKLGTNQQVLKNLIENDNMDGRILWYDLSANLDILNSEEKVIDIVNKTAKANINTIVLDVKSSTGFVPYKSKYSPHLSESKNPKYSNYPADFDLVEYVVREAKKHDIEIHLNINTFSAGSVPFEEGPAIDNKDWQTIVYDVKRMLTVKDKGEIEINGFNRERGADQLIVFTPEEYDISPSNRWGVEVAVKNNVVIEISDRNETDAPALSVPENGYILSGNGLARNWLLENISVEDDVDITQVNSELKPVSETSGPSAFMNPIHPEVQQFTWDVISELVEGYDIDGITLDRARYNNIYTDFSDMSKAAFEQEIGQKVENFPEDIFTVEFEGSKKVEVPGKHYKEWIKWRASNIETYFEDTKDIVRNLDPNVLFNTYVGSWHPLYYSEGVNWGSKNYYPSGDEYSWAADDYNETGYLDHLDFIMTGLYFKDVYIDDLQGLPDWYSVEGAANLSMEVTNFEAFNYGALFLLDYADDPAKFKEAIEMTKNKTHGIMLFDLIYIENYGWWNIIEEVFAEDSRAPHTVPEIPELQNLIKEADLITNDGEIYTASSYEALQDGIESALLAVKTETDFANIIASLQSDIDGLEEVRAEEPIDITELEELITEAENITNDKDKYTEDSYQALQEAINKAKESTETINTEEALITAITNLQLAIDGLEKTVAEESIDLTELEELITEAESITNDKDKYTEGSYQALQDAILGAKEALSTIDSEEDLDASLLALQTAIDSLILEKGGSDTDTVVTKDEQKEGSALPKTATSIFNFLLVGVMLLVLGAGFYVVMKRRKHV